MIQFCVGWVICYFIAIRHTCIGIECMPVYQPCLGIITSQGAVLVTLGIHALQNHLLHYTLGLSFTAQNFVINDKDIQKIYMDKLMHSLMFIPRLLVENHHQMNALMIAPRQFLSNKPLVITEVYLEDVIRFLINADQQDSYKNINVMFVL